MCRFRPAPGVTVELNFEGCITEANIDTVPQSPGIYVAFVCGKSTDNNGDYPCSQIAYIGKAKSTNNLRKRIQEHFDNDHSEWAEKCKLSDTETFVYTYSVFDDPRLSDVESALIFNNQPIVNIQHKDRYNGRSKFLWINCGGNIGLLKPQISVVRFIQ